MADPAVAAAVRSVHVATALLVLAAALVALAWPRVARAVEAASWAGLSVMVASGIGNLAALGEATRGLPWGGLFGAKLLAVLALLWLAALRTVLVVRGAGPRALRAMYGLTAAVLVGVFALGWRLAHG